VYSKPHTTLLDRAQEARDDRRVFLYAFDLIGLDGDDVRREPIEARKAALAKIRHAKGGLPLNEHINEPGDLVLRHACKLGLEGIVSKRLGSPYLLIPKSASFEVVACDFIFLRTARSSRSAILRRAFVFLRLPMRRGVIQVLSEPLPCSR
jgi:hypothetical protein